MSTLDLSRWQFGITTVYHFFMVPLTISLGLIVAVFHTRWYRSGDPRWERLTKFFGKLFLINFAMGVATGIVQEFQFGMNWAPYSRFVGDVFGAPLAMEALVAFFLESTFLGLWIFGWGRLSPKLHLATIWAAAIGTTLSAYFIIAANSWMQHPVGVKFNAETGRAEMTSIWKVLTNPTTLTAYPHVIMGALVTGATFVGAISVWEITKKRASLPQIDIDAFHAALKTSMRLLLVSGALLALTGDLQAQMMFKQQPMKMASAEALCHTEKGAGLSLFAIGDISPGDNATCDVKSITVPQGLSLLATHKTNETVEGVSELQAAFVERYGEGDYSPNLFVTYWSFRLMIALGLFSAAGAVLGFYLMRGGREVPNYRWLPMASLITITTPFLANGLGWIFTEMGRQPWVVAPNPDGIPEIALKTADAVSNISAVNVWISMIGFVLVYGFLAVIEIKLLTKYVKGGPQEAVATFGSSSDSGDELAFAY